jgi:plastocyanin
MKLTKLFLTTAIIALVGAGCASTPAPTANKNTNTPTIGTVREKPASGSFTITMNPTTGEFIPVSAYVTKGTKVTFKNTTDKPIHIVPSADLPSRLSDLDSKTDIAPGGSFDYVFNKPGRWLYQNSKNMAFGGAVEVLE